MKLYNNELVISQNSQEAVESILINRTMMHQTVYQHHTKRIVEAMFKRALQCLFDQGDLTYEEFIKMDDIDVVSSLRRSNNYPRKMMERVDIRRLFKIFYSEKISRIEENFRRELLKNEETISKKIADDYDIENGDVILDMPETKMSEFRIRILSEEGLRYIHEVSSLASSLKESIEEKLHFRIYLPQEEFKKMKPFDVEEYIQLTQKKLGSFM